MYQFPFAAITNYHNISGLNNILIFLQFWVSEIQRGFHWAKIKVLAWPQPFGRVQKKLHFLAVFSFQSCIPCIPWFGAFCSMGRASRKQFQISLCFLCHHIIFSLACSQVSLLWTLMITIRAHPDKQDNLPSSRSLITSAKFLSLCEITFPGPRDQDLDTLGPSLVLPQIKY